MHWPNMYYGNSVYNYRILTKKITCFLGDNLASLNPLVLKAFLVITLASVSKMILKQKDMDLMLLQIIQSSNLKCISSQINYYYDAWLRGHVKRLSYMLLLNTNIYIKINSNCIIRSRLKIFNHVIYERYLISSLYHNLGHREDLYWYGNCFQLPYPLYFVPLF